MSSIEELDCSGLNATECILRAATSILAEVKQSGSEYNWDPLTFASTVVIGVVALFFAGLTIGQGLIASGPGRPKCSKYALGPWAQLSRRRMDWSELRYQSVAYTPVIRVKTLLRVSWPDQDGWDNTLDETTLKLLSSYDWGKRATKLAYKPKDLNDYFPASWLGLLTRVGLDHPGLWDLKPARGDYIPSDLAVAPAYASTRDIISIFALVSFPYRFQILQSEDSKVVSVRARDLDLDFRQHALLGTYCVFQNFGSPERHQKWYGKGAEFLFNRADPLMLWILLQANGYIHQHKIMGNKLVTGLGHAMYSLKGYDFVERQMIIQKSRLQMLCRQCKCSQNDDLDQCCGLPHRYWPSWCMLKGGIGDIGILKDLCMDMCGLDLLAAEAPPAIPILFPKKSMRVDEKLWGLLALSRFWSLGCPPELEDCQPADAPWASEENMLFTRDERPYEPINSGKTQKSFVTALTPFRTCRDYAQGKRRSTSSTQLNFDELPATFYMVRAEVAKLDRWLAKNVEESTLRCRWLSLSCASAALTCIVVRPNSGFRRHYPWNLDAGSEANAPLPIDFPSAEIGAKINGLVDRISRFRSWDEQNPDDRTVLRLIFSSYLLPDVLGELYKFLNLWEVDAAGDKFVYPRNMVQHPLDDLLIYRALLIAVLLDAATDNSEIVENEVYQKIIPVL